MDEIKKTKGKQIKEARTTGCGGGGLGNGRKGAVPGLTGKK